MQRWALRRPQPLVHASHLADLSQSRKLENQKAGHAWPQFPSRDLCRERWKYTLAWQEEDSRQEAADSRREHCLVRLLQLTWQWA